MRHLTFETTAAIVLAVSVVLGAVVIGLLTAAGL